MQKSGISYFTHIFPLTLTHAVVSSITLMEDVIFMAIFQTEFLFGLLNFYLALSSGAVVTVHMYNTTAPGSQRTAMLSPAHLSFS